MSFDNEPDLEIGDIVGFDTEHYKGAKWDKNITAQRFRRYEHLRFKITGFKPFDGEKDIVILEPINGKVIPGFMAPYGWNGIKKFSVSCIDVILIQRPESSKIMSDEQVTISKKEYDSLLNSDKILAALEGAGVDNWQGYDYAMETLDDENEDG